MSENRYERISKVMSMNVMAELTEQLSSIEPKILRPAIRIFGHLSFAPEDTVNKFCTPVFLEKIYNLLFSQVSLIRFDACWTISNLLLTSASIYDQLFRKFFIERIIHTAMNDKSLNNCSEAFECIFSFINRGSHSQIEELILDYSILDVLIICLDRNSEKVILNVLKCLDHLLCTGEELKKGTERNEIAYRITQNNYFNNMLNLQGLKNKEIYNKVINMLEFYIDPILQEE